MKKIVLLWILLCPALCCLGQTGDYEKSLEFLQGDGVYESGMMTFLTGLKDAIWSNFGLFIADAQALAAIFMIVYFAIKSYEMMAGDKKLEVMPLLRPFGLAMVILWWGGFTRMVAFPTDLVAGETQEMFASEQNNVNQLRFQRAGLMKQVADSLYTFQAQTEVAAKESDSWYGKAWDAVTSTVKEGIATVVAPLMELKARLQISIQLLMTQLLELAGIWLLRAGTYIIFMIQIIYSSVLIILGPFAVAVSILPAFRDSFSTWVARFVSVNLYSGISYLVMYLCALMQKYALTSEISKYQELLRPDGSGLMTKFAFFAGNGILSFGSVIVVFFIGAVCMFTVPSISTWIISTSGISSASSAFGRNATMVVMAAKRAGGAAL